MARPRTCTSRPLGRRRAVCGSSLSMKIMNQKKCLLCVHSSPPRWYFVPARVGPVDLGSAVAAARLGAHLGTGSGRTAPGSGKISWDRQDGLGEDQLGLGEAGAAERPAGSGGAGRGRGGAGTKSGSLAASGSCAVWSPEAERRRKCGLGTWANFCPSHPK